MSEESNKTYVLNETKDNDVYLLKKIEEETRKIKNVSNLLYIGVPLAIVPVIVMFIFYPISF